MQAYWLKMLINQPFKSHSKLKLIQLACGLLFLLGALILTANKSSVVSTYKINNSSIEVSFLFDKSHLSVDNQEHKVSDLYLTSHYSNIISQAAKFNLRAQQLPDLDLINAQLPFDTNDVFVQGRQALNPGKPWYLTINSFNKNRLGGWKSSNLIYQSLLIYS